MTFGILTRLKGLLAAVGLALGLLGAAYLKGRSAQSNDSQVDDLENTIKTHEAINEVTPSTDADAAFERLRRNGWLR